MSLFSSIDQAGRNVLSDPDTYTDSDGANVPLGDGSEPDCNLENNPNDYSDDSVDSDPDNLHDDYTNEVTPELLRAKLQEVLERTDPSPSDRELETLIRKADHSYYPTALHVLVDLKRPYDEALGTLVELLIKTSNQILTIGNHSGFTALHFAIYEQRADIVRHICSAYSDIHAIIDVPSKDMKNCLHLAIEKNLDLGVLRSLAEKASITALCAQDNEGNTPLHLAVKFDHCRADQISLIRFMVDKCDGKMKDAENETEDWNSIFNEAKCSPYQVWEQSIEAKKKERKEREKKERERARGLGQAAQGSDSAKGIRLPTIEAPEQPPTGPHRPNETAPKIRKSTDVAKKGESKRRRSRMGKEENVQLTMGFAQEIGDFLRNHYLQNRSPSAALKIFYGKDTTTGESPMPFFSDQIVHVSNESNDQRRRQILMTGDYSPSLR